MPFRGSFEHTLDDRGRVAIPAKYRDQFPNNLAVITPSIEGCLRVFPEADFQKMSEELASTPATTVRGRRLLRQEIFQSRVKRQGRILISARLRQHAGLDGTVVVAGNRECLEIWEPGRW